MKTIGWILLFAVYTSPLTFVLSGCQWKPDGQAPLADTGPQWVITKVGEPLPPPPPTAPPTEIPVTYDPLRVPSEDDPYAPPPRVVLPKNNPPLTADQKAMLQGGCANGNCFAPESGQNYTNTPQGSREGSASHVSDVENRRERRGLLRRMFGR